jgi:hypothetical protein
LFLLPLPDTAFNEIMGNARAHPPPQSGSPAECWHVLYSGCRLPTQSPDGRSRCFCGEMIDFVGTRRRCASGRSSMPAWSRKFDEPIELPDGRKLRTLKEAIAFLAKEIPKSEHTLPKVQAAARMVTEAAENDGPMIFARIGVMQAVHRHMSKSLVRRGSLTVGASGSMKPIQLNRAFFTAEPGFPRRWSCHQFREQQHRMV